ncbi:MAG TPA: HAD-IA family hydrolase [Candidatus Saccharimonadales bacterium]|nr:HAD-IA family hydrolase [Candidatus Saccharimonadales bacterium]
MAMDERGLGKRLQEARLRAGLTQQQLCHKANLSFSTLTKIERGAIKSPSIFTIQSIASALDLSLDDLIGHNQGETGRQLKETKTGVSFVYFDVNGCLVYFYQRAFDKLALISGAHLEAVESAFWHYNDQACKGEISLDDFNAKLAERLGMDKLRWQDYYIENVEPIKEMQELLVWTAKQYKVGLLTNIMPGLIGSMRRNGQLPNINYDAVIDSSAVGAIKPEINIYKEAVKQAGVSPESILLIDDDRINLMAAERLGWHVMWFDDSHPADSVERARQALEPSS